MRRTFTVAALVVAGCSSPINYYRHTPPASSAYCATASCPPGERPIVLGGKDVAPPTLENVDYWQSRGFFAGVSFAAVKAQYQSAGFVWSDGTASCGCRCFDTEHVVKGGKCIDAAFPGSVLHQQIHTSPPR
jgi:hypothetical protein